MNRFVSIFMVISFALLILACTGSDEKTEQVSNDSFEFRKTRWGMTMEEVKSSEDISPSKEKDNNIVYKEQFNSIPSTVGYIFVDGKLVKAAYLFNERNQNPDDYIVTYERIKGLLINDYGPPTLDEVKWIDEDKTDSTDDLGKSVCEGEVSYKSEWIVENTFIELVLDGVSSRCRQGVIFQSKEHYNLEQNKVKSLQPDVKVE